MRRIPWKKTENEMISHLEAAFEIYKNMIFDMVERAHAVMDIVERQGFSETASELQKILVNVGKKRSKSKGKKP